MNNWYLREPVGKILGKYSFDASYRKFFDTEEVLVFAVTQDEGMIAGVITPMVKTILDEISLNVREKGTIYLSVDKKRSQLTTLDKLKKELVALVQDTHSPWYWDGVQAIIRTERVELLIQSESDGMDVAVYITGSGREGLFNKLLSLIDKPANGGVKA